VIRSTGAHGEKRCPFWAKAQQTLRRKLGDRRWDLIGRDSDHLIAQHEMLTIATTSRTIGTNKEGGT